MQTMIEGRGGSCGGAIRISGAMTEFSTWIDDLEFFGSSLIWRILHLEKGGNHTCASRTNRSEVSDDELLQETQLAMELEEVAKRKEIAWRHRSKNSKSSQRFNTIDSPEVDGVLITDPAEAKDPSRIFNRSYIRKLKGGDLDLHLQGAAVISNEYQEWLQREFVHEETLESIRLCLR
ncbi:hypothetical protein H5410_017352 [Solanum commersonii]|uniref:Uncharacterized protein n=1 Tax=Solanum commersonii TaxID=4109 RepID=A0A9J5ZZ71_SOLCO|nr:hypothetical protein H5410_017352 [Solanum commersonii]